MGMRTKIAILVFVLMMCLGNVVAFGSANEAGGRLIIFQRVSGTHTFLSGVGYDVRRLSDDEQMGIITTDHNGEATINLPIGDYYVRQVYAPSGYTVNNARVNFKIAWHEITYLNLSIPAPPEKGIPPFEPHPTPVPVPIGSGFITVFSHCAETQVALKGTVFEITRMSDGSHMALLTTNNSGTASIELWEGYYQLREMTPSAGYEPNNERHTINVRVSSNTARHFTSYPIVITKNSPTPTPYDEPTANENVVVEPPPMYGTSGIMPFVDVSQSDWYYRYVYDVWSKEIFRGTSATHFEPNMPLSRGMVVTIFANVAQTDLGIYRSNVPRFPDVEVGEWYAPGVNWATSMGIVSGYDDGKFHPDRNVTREELAVLLEKFINHRRIELPVTYGFDTGFNDISKVSPWSITAVKRMAEVNLITANAYFFYNPKEAATRAEVAQSISRLIEWYGR